MQLMHMNNKRKKHNLIVGQYVILQNSNNANYNEAFVRSAFDDTVILQLENNKHFKFDYNIGESSHWIQVPKVNGRIVMAKKTIFGRYKVEPNTKKNKGDK